MAMSQSGLSMFGWALGLLNLAIKSSHVIWVGFLIILVIELIQAYGKPRGLWNKSSPGFNGLLAYVVRAWH